MTVTQHQLDAILPTALSGTVVETLGVTAAVADFPAPLGAIVEIEKISGGPVEAEVIAFRNGLTIVYPFGEISGVRHGSQVVLRQTTRTLRVGDALLGRVVDAHARCVDDRHPPLLEGRVRLDRRPPRHTERPTINQPLSTGIRAIDGMLTCGKGQRIGIFSGSGVGKSVALGMMSRYTSADVNVIALVGERGREVNQFIEHDLGPDGLARSVVVVATSDEPALMRVHAAKTATSIAEHFRDQGRDVLLIMDSITRFAMAQRELGLAAGEPPTTRGYPPSVFAMLPKLVERTGRAGQGSITAFYSVLVEGDDSNEPISDAVRGLLDGHIWLSRKLASSGHYPAIDVLESLSRLMPQVTAPQHAEAAIVLRRLLAAYRDHEDLISIGAYRRGSNPSVDAAIELQQPINELLRQRVTDSSTVDQAAEAVLALAQKAASLSNATPALAGRA
jgi:flagellum-specific ATP synthase